MKKIKLGLFVALFSLVVLGFNVPANAAEIIYQEDIMQKVVTKDVLVRTADNVIVLVDASSSMDTSHRKYKKTNYEMEKEALAAGYSRLPDLGYNVGIYNFSPTWKEIYPVQKFDAAKVAEAMKQLPAKPSGRTPLVAGLEKLEGVLKGLSGKTVVYIFSDGGWEAAGKKDPGDKTAELARKYNVCFMVISLRRGPGRHQAGQGHGQGQCLLAGDPLRFLHHEPLLCLGAFVLHDVRDVGRDNVREENRGSSRSATSILITTSSSLKPQEKEELNQVGKFLQANPKAFVALQGFCDNRGTPEYNMKLSRERAEAVADYLTKNFKLDSGRVVPIWYGEANPVASNDTPEGRAKNRRVEVSVSGL